MTFTSIIKNIDSLPPLSNVAYVVQKLYAAGLESLDIKRLIKVIESDAMLTATILKTINSPYYSFNSKISSISQSISLLGVVKIHAMIINYAISQNIKADPSIYGFKDTQFNDLCQLQSALMLKWFSTINASEAKFLSSLALIMESGKLILAQEVIKSDYCGEFRKGYNECECIQEYEKSIINTTSYYLTGMLFEHWKLEPIYVSILKNLDFDKDVNDEISQKSELYKNALNIIRISINAKDILSDTAIKKSSNIVKNIGYDAKTFEHEAYKLRESYLESMSI